MKLYENPPVDLWNKLIKRPLFNCEDLYDTVQKVFADVEQFGNQAVTKYTNKFDGVQLNEFEVSKEVIRASEEKVSLQLKQAITLAKTNITKFHRSQLNENDDQKVETSIGVKCWLEKHPIEKVGIYIPGGTAPLFSSILMLAIPAKLAGCKEIIICSPPNKDGVLSDVLLYTSKICKVDRVFKIGGIQAIAAFGIGTESVPKVHKVFGPGNQYVTAAKQYLQNYQIPIDLPAGPSEVLILADDSATPEFVASDLLAQAEHGTDSQVILVSTSKELINKVLKEVELQIPSLSRKHIIKKSIKFGRAIWFEDVNQAIDFSNAYAPEHLILVTQNSDEVSLKIKNAGSVFIGNYSPESVGDYASGTNHTLPTNGSAVQYSGVTVDSFKKSITFQTLSPMGLVEIGPYVEKLALAEGLDAHKNAVSIRLKQLNKTI